MARAIVDPEELRRFAAGLKQFCERMNADMTQLQGRMHALGNTWRDQEHEKFASEFEETMRSMARFTRSAEEHIPFLMRKAERIEDYLRQR